MDVFLGVLAVSGFVFGLLGFGLSTFALIKVFAMEKSTHQIVYHNPFEDGEEEKTFPKPKEGILRTESDEDWANSEEDIETMNKKAKENLDVF